MKKRILGIVLSFAMVATVVINPMTSNASDAVEIAKYRSEEGHTAPTELAPEGKVFAGWYTDATYSTPIAEDKLDGTAVPKWVDAKVLTVKYQFTNGLTVHDSETALRLVTTVDSLAYKQVGFVLNNGTKDSAPAMSDTVYEQLLGGGKTYNPKTTFCNDSEYFAVYEISSMPNIEFTTSLTVTPQWETLDGTVVTGQTCDAFSVGSTLRENITRISDDGVATIYNYSGVRAIAYYPQDVYSKGSQITFNVTISPAQNFFTVHVYGNKTNTEYFAQAYSGESGIVSFNMIEDEEVYILVTFEEGKDHSKNVVTLSNFKVIEPQIVIGDDGTITIKNAAGNQQIVYYPEVDYASGTAISFNLNITPVQEYFTVHVIGETSGTEYIGNAYNGADATIAFTMGATEKIRIIVTYSNEGAYNENVATIRNLVTGNCIKSGTYDDIRWSNHIAITAGKSYDLTFDFEVLPEAVGDYNILFFNNDTHTSTKTYSATTGGKQSFTIQNIPASTTGTIYFRIDPPSSMSGTDTEQTWVLSNLKQTVK